MDVVNQLVDALGRLFDNFLSVLAQTPTNYTERFFWLYVATFIAFGYLGYKRYHTTRHGFWRFLFPKAIYLHRSSFVDYGIYLINIFISPITALFGVAVNTATILFVAQALIGWNGGDPVFQGEWNYSVNLLFILGFTLIADLTVYIVHRRPHALDVLWPIHALHHSAEVMTPVTLFRKHPLWNFTANLTTAFLTGLFQGVFIFLFYGTPDYSILFGISTIYVVYNFFASNLRHSHIWLSWGKPLSYIFISPAMHQIHHDPNRLNKNYGEIFAIWDWMFGSLYIPEKREKFEIGLPDGNPHNTVARAYYVPIVEMGRAIVNKVKPG